MNPLPESLEGQFLRHSILFSEAPTQDLGPVSFWSGRLSNKAHVASYPPWLDSSPAPVPTIVLLLRGTFLGSLLFRGSGGRGAPRVPAPTKGHPS